MISLLAQTANGTTLSEAAELARQVCAATDSQQVRELLALPPAGNQQ